MAPPSIFDRRTYRARRARAERQNCESFLAEEAAQSLFERIAAANRSFVRALDLGSRRQSFEKLKPLAAKWVHAPPCIGNYEQSVTTVVVDEECLPFADRSFDLVTSVLSLHTVNDLPGTLIQIRKVLAPEGLFVAAFFGGATLQELRRALAGGEGETLGGISPRVAPFADIRDAGALLQRAGFALPVSDLERATVRYRNFLTLVSDVRALGETNALTERSRKSMTRATLASSLRRYGDYDAEPDGRLRATFDTIYVTGWAPSK